MIRSCRALGAGVSTWLAAGILATQGCDRAAEAGAATRQSSSAALPVRIDSPPSVAQQAIPAPPAGSTGSTGAPGKSGLVVSPDSVRPHGAAGRDSMLRGALLPGRTAHDSTSFLDAVRLGRKEIGLWPKDSTAPGAILPFKRIVAFYGNPLSKKMGVLGEYPVDEMLAKLDTAVAQWQAADPSTPVQPALHLIAVVAQASPGRDGKYRLRMDTSLIEQVYGWARGRHALLFLDVQVGKSSLQEELPRLLPFLARPDVHLGIDPEFSMHYEREGMPPSSKIGEMDAADVNFAVQTLAKVAVDNHIPPKILIVHRFTTKMVLNVSQIRVDPHVQVVMDMDGHGPPWLKFDSYRDYIVANPVEYTGFKIFFHADAKTGETLLTPAELMHLIPPPLYVQYQ